MGREFVHLHLHSEYSLQDSTVRLRPLMEQVRARGMGAVALTDQANMFAAVKHFKAAIAAGIKPIFGADVWIRHDERAEPLSRLVLLCQDEIGYGNLKRLISRAYRDGQLADRATIEAAWLRDANTGLIALSAGLDGDIGQAFKLHNVELAEDYLAAWREIFGERFFLELQRTGRAHEEPYIAQAVAWSRALGVPVVATNDVRFVDADDFEAHEVRVCICTGFTLDDERRPRLYSPQQYLRSTDEMCELFADIPEAIDNTVAIARACNLRLELGAAYLPEYPVPDGFTTETYFRHVAEAGLEKRLEFLARQRDDDQALDREPYDARLQTELDVIIGMGFPGYFLIVMDFIAWAKRHSIPVGPGRGSGAGSLVAYALEITDLDPLAYELLFERFLNPERVSMPDFDIDFCMDRRDEVIDYVAELYGRNQVSQIITYGSMAAKAVIRDVGRVLSHPYGFVDRIAKLVPFEVGMTLDKALESEAALRELYEQEEEVTMLIDMARSLEGLSRNVGKHAGGVVIAPSDLTDFTPLYCEPGGSGLVSQYDKDDVEAVGLVKFDFLGLRTLTIIDWAVDAINAGRDGDSLDIASIPLDDAATFGLLQDYRTTAVFQLESRGMKDLIRRLRPDSFEDIIALVALFRPGPLQSGMVDDFIDRKHGRARVEYPHPALESILKPTYGVILYQEQVMQIAQILAGYTLGGADLLRRAMGKKKPEEMAKQREIFVGGAVERGVAERTATRIFDLMEKFAGYGFNKSHSAAYAVLAYQTAYLKAHYPAAFMAAVMSADLDNTDRLVTLKEDCRKQGLTIVAPSVNESGYAFGVADDRTIIYGLGAIKGVGRAVVEAIIEEREANGAYTSLTGFCRRVNHDKINRRALEALIKAGAMDTFGQSRCGLMAEVAAALANADQEARAAAAGQNDMFGLDEPALQTEGQQPEVIVSVPEWPEADLLRCEKEALGLYLTGHPFAAVRADAMAFVDGKLADLMAEPQPQSVKGERNYAQQGREVTVAGLIADIRKRGNRVSVTLDDDTARMEIGFFSEAFQEFRELLLKDEIVVISGTLRYDDFLANWTVNAKQVQRIDRVIESRAEGMVLCLTPNGEGEQLLVQLHDVLLPYRQGSCGVSVQYVGETAEARLTLGPEWSVRPSRELRDKLTELLGSKNVRMLYSPRSEIR